MKTYSIRAKTYSNGNYIFILCTFPDLEQITCFESTDSMLYDDFKEYAQDGTEDNLFLFPTFKELLEHIISRFDVDLSINNLSNNNLI